MLCASSLELEERLRQAAWEQEKVQPAQRADAALNGSGLKQIEAAARRYDKSLSAFLDHKRSCTLCSNS
jgi:hypothetical protein